MTQWQMRINVGHFYPIVTGFLIDFIAAPVVAGFASAAAFTIATTQIESLLGLEFEAEGFLNTWIAVFQHIEETKKWDAVLGFSSIAILLLLRVSNIQFNWIVDLIHLFKFRFLIKWNWAKKERENDGKIGSTRDAGWFQCRVTQSSSSLVPSSLIVWLSLEILVSLSL